MMNERITLSYGSDYTPVPYTLSNLNCVLYVKLCNYAKNIHRLRNLEPNFSLRTVQSPLLYWYVSDIKHAIFVPNAFRHKRYTLDLEHNVHSCFNNQLLPNEVLHDLHKR